jgi:hypothetical protein
MAKRFPAHPKHPERICWGCDHYCAVDAMRCGNGSGRTQHPVEYIGEDWLEWESERADEAGAPLAASAERLGGGAKSGAK